MNTTAPTAPKAAITFKTGKKGGAKLPAQILQERRARALSIKIEETYGVFAANLAKLPETAKEAASVADIIEACATCARLTFRLGSELTQNHEENLKLITSLDATLGRLRRSFSGEAAPEGEESGEEVQG